MLLMNQLSPQSNKPSIINRAQMSKHELSLLPFLRGGFSRSAYFLDVGGGAVFWFLKDKIYNCGTSYAYNMTKDL